MTYLPSLDGLRGIAILLVILFHTFMHSGDTQTTLANTLLDRFSSSGWLGVDIFFVLSGFLITGILFDSKQAANRVRTFYARRVLRIFPIYYAFLGVGVIAAAFSHDRFNPPSLYHWLFMGNLPHVQLGEAYKVYQHLWSLAQEEQYYLVWPWVVLFVRREWVMWICTLLLATSVLLRIAIADNFSTFAPFGQLARLDGLVVGSWIALLLRGKSQRPARFAVHALVASACLVTAVAIWRGGLSIGDIPSYTYAPFAISLGTGALLLVLSGQQRGPRFLSSSFLTVVGRYSYAMYLFHWPLVLVARHLPFLRWKDRLTDSAPMLLLVACGVAIASFVLAYASWHLLERRFLALKRYFPRSSSDRADVPALVHPV